MPRGRKAKVAVTEREYEIITMLRKGYSQLAVAEKLGIEQATVSGALKRVSDRMMRGSEESLRLMREEQSVKLEKIYQDAIDMYEACKTNNDSKNAFRYQDTAMKALNDLRKIWGADVPVVQKTENVNTNTNTNTNLHAEIADDDPILERLRAASRQVMQEKARKYLEQDETDK